MIAYVTVSSEMLQELYLPQRTLRQNLFAEDIGHLLDRDTLLCLGIRGRAVNGISFSKTSPWGAQRVGCIPDYAISTLAKFLRHRVSLVDNEVLIEYFEHFPALQIRHVVGEDGISRSAVRSLERRPRGLRGLNISTKFNSNRCPTCSWASDGCYRNRALTSSA